MGTLKLQSLDIKSPTKLVAVFDQPLNPLLNTSNLTLEVNTPGIQEPEVLKVSVKSNRFTIVTRPLFPLALYFLTFKVGTQPFNSLHGDFTLQIDGKNNVTTFLGSGFADNIFKQRLQYNLSNDIYNLNSSGIIDSVLDALADVIQRAYYDTKKLKNDNYLSFLVENEVKTRGTGPRDRLNEENAYQVLSVRRNLAGTVFDGSLSYAEFPFYPVTLQAAIVNQEVLTAGTAPGTFDQLTLRVRNFPITRVNSVVFRYSDGSSFVYDLTSLGYQIQNNRYDQELASVYVTLDSDQIRLNESVLDQSGFVPLGADDQVLVGYEYKNLGRLIQTNSVQVTEVKEAVREVTEPIKTIFSLKHYPIIDANNNIVTSDGVEFLDPQSNPPFSETHPAFLKEVPFHLDKLPSGPGQFSVEYSTGTVYCYGALANDGTGDYPPVASYTYRRVYVNDVDYTYDSTTSEVVRSPLRDLEGLSLEILFDYQNILVPGVDYVPEVHTESIDERIDNRLTSTTSLQVLNSPITNVFRVFNETSGEVYTIDRFDNVNVYFNYQTPPKIEDVTREKVTFQVVSNETLLVNTQLTNAGSLLISRFPLANNNIISASDDTLGSSFNSSVSFSRVDLFQEEIYFDGQTETIDSNLDRLTAQGQYLVDYANGVVYLVVSPLQDSDYGTISYKKFLIETSNDHIIGVNKLYNSISFALGDNKIIEISSFGDQTVQPSTLERSDERFDQFGQPYVIADGIIEVQADVGEVRGIYDHYDLTNNIIPTNFIEEVSFSDTEITVGKATKQETLVIQPGLTLDATVISPGAEVVAVSSVIRTSDNQELTVSGISGYTITLDGTHGEVAGQTVQVTYQLGLNGSATPVVDYSKGDYFIDYEYLADEILVSYEYGDNSLNFADSDALSIGETYYVTYLAGALRDSLLNNFGGLLNIPIVNNFDLSIARERYRDALRGALQAFPKGPTIPAIKAIVSNITHMEPEIIESLFEGWNLGTSFLKPNNVQYPEGLQLQAGKFDAGVQLDGYSVTFPVSSNLSLNQGTLETWVIPSWDGLDNDATLSFELFKDGLALDEANIFYGASSTNPESNQFSLDKDVATGFPSQIYYQTGIFIYYDIDNKLWKLLAKDSTSSDSIYSGTILSSGKFYHSDFIYSLGELSDIKRTAGNKLEFELHIDGYEDPLDGYDGYGDGYEPGYAFDGIQWMSDQEHYLMDFGETSTKNRFSLFKDGAGYLKFRVFDNHRDGLAKEYSISSDISDWIAGEKHHIAIAWKLNNPDGKDEMHLFVDGQEVPNIVKYGGVPSLDATDRFRQVKPEILLGTLPKNIVTTNDVTTTAGSTTIVSESVDFGIEGIIAGDTVEFEEVGLGSFTIATVLGNVLILTAPVGATLSDARISVNPYQANVNTEITLYPNLMVSLIRGGEEIELPGVRAEVPGYRIEVDSFNQNVLTILGNALAGDQVAIRTLGINHKKVKERYYLWGNTSNVIKTKLPSPVSLDEVVVRPVILPYFVVGPSNASFAAGLFTSHKMVPTAVSNTTEGRSLEIRVAGGNTDFSTPVLVQITGTSTGGAVETLSFSEPGKQITVNKWKTISFIIVIVKPYNSSKNSCGVEVKEAYSVIISEGNASYPALRYSFQEASGTTLESTGGTTVTDNSGYFVDSFAGGYLIITAPPAAVGSYAITSVTDSHNLVIGSVVPAFSGGSYTIWDPAIGRAGFQNGYFTFQEVGTVNTPYDLPQGVYEFIYSTDLAVRLDPLVNQQVYLGTDFQGNNPLGGVLDELRILSEVLTDVRVGEVGNSNSITANFTRLTPFRKNSNTLTLLHFDNLPLVNEADFWITRSGQFLQSVSSVNSEFQQALLINRQPLVVDNAGYLSTASEGTIEFWISPLYDTGNDPVRRYYFDASVAVREEIFSTDNSTIELPSRASEVLSIHMVKKPDFNYTAGATLDSNRTTVHLGKALLYQNTPILVSYIPYGVRGNRLSIFKDTNGYLVFQVSDNGTDYQVSSPIFWEQDSWHRVMVTFRFNDVNNTDHIRILVDGEEKGIIRYGSGLLYGTGVVYGQGTVGIDTSLITDINFRDLINYFVVGGDYLGFQPAMARMDNLRISNKSRTPLTINGTARDINYRSNTDAALPVVEDLFTTYLLNFDVVKTKNEDFAKIRSRNFGNFNFTLNVLDSFDIIQDNPKVQPILEAMVKALKPARSKATINYLR